MELKYVITDHNNFAIFSPGTDHIAIAKQLYGKPIGAGFCNIRVGHIHTPGAHDLDIEKTNINIHCYGRSVTLDLESREEDEKIINDKLNNPY